MIAVLALLVGCAGCGGDGDTGAQPQGTGETDGTPVKGGILRVGSINYIDSLNPFNYIESQAYQAMLMIYPQLVQYAHGRRRARDRGRLGRVLGDLGGRQGLDVQASSRAERGPTASRSRPTTPPGRSTRPSSTRAGRRPSPRAALAHVESAEATDDNTLVIHYDAPVGNVLAQLEQFFILPQHVWEPLVGANGKGLKTFHPEQNLPVVSGRRLHDQGVREEGHDGLHPLGGLLRRAVQRRGGHAHLLHELGLDDLRAPAGQPRLGRPGAVQRGEGPRRRTTASSSTRFRAPRRRTSPGTRTRASRRTASSSTRR